jgi:NDP-sugar pyrophosphorylase family protein
MKAMLFAAGKGTRLQPLTNTLPKCLVKAGSKTLLEHNILYLKKAGVNTIIVNVHHLANQVVDFIAQRDFGVEVHISLEEELLETGGGLMKAKEHFINEETFVVCNSDVFTDFDLNVMIEIHKRNKNLATLAVSDRKTSRYFRFNEQDLLCGWENQTTGEEISWGHVDYHLQAFNSVQIISSEIFGHMGGFEQKFSTIPVYLQAAQKGKRIEAFSMKGAYWIDIGTIEKLEELRSFLNENPGGDSNPRLVL